MKKDTRIFVEGTTRVDVMVEPIDVLNEIITNIVPEHGHWIREGDRMLMTSERHGHWDEVRKLSVRERDIVKVATKLKKLLNGKENEED